jgi:hypothetical protein
VKRKHIISATVVAAALLITGLASGAGVATKKTSLKATLNVGQEVPKPIGVRRGATGLFTSILSKKSDGSGTLIGSSHLDG